MRRNAPRAEQQGQRGDEGRMSSRANRSQGGVPDSGKRAGKDGARLRRTRAQARRGSARGMRNLRMAGKSRRTMHPAPERAESWRSGALALWRSGALALWRSGALALWRSGALALWRSGALALWRSGALALWRSGALALWRSGALALWRSGALALWRSGALAQLYHCTAREIPHCQASFVAHRGGPDPGPCATARTGSGGPAEFPCHYQHLV